MKLTVFHGDITTLKVDVIVNAANSQLTPGGGVCGAIHRAAGPELAEECKALSWCSAGGSVITNGYRLNAPKVIHAVGPVWIDGHFSEPASLHSAYFSSLRLAMANNLRRIAFPCISTGIYGYPSDAACSVALMAAADFARVHPGKIDEVIFCCFSEEDAQRYRKALGIES